MADRIAITGIAPYDGEYDFDTSYFTNRELHTVKRLAGVRAGELNDALAAGDTDVIVALAIIAMQRQGKQVNEDAFWNAEIGGIAFVADEAEEDDGIPPAQPATPSERVSDEKQSVAGASSTSGSGNGSGSSASGRSLIGMPGSPTPAVDSDRVTSAI